MPAAWAMSSARVAFRPRLTKRPAAARAISIRVAALRRSVSEAGAGVGVELITSAGYAHVAQSAIRAGHPVVQVRGAPPSRRTRTPSVRLAGHVRPQSPPGADIPTRRTNPRDKPGANTGGRIWPNPGELGGQKGAGPRRLGERRRSPAQGESRRRGDVRRDLAHVGQRPGEELQGPADPNSCADLNSRALKSCSRTLPG